LDENNAVTLLLRGKIYTRQGNPDAALADLNRTVELEPEMGWGYQERAFIYGAMGSIDEAVADFNQAIALDPNDSWNYAGLGDTLYDAGRRADALQAYKTYVEQAGDDAQDYIKERITELEK
jgi:tetratricopeptide (TPR) repeat protein